MTVKQYQCLLCYLDHYRGAVDGICGPATKQAIRDFQTASGLDADGVFGPVTEEKLLQALTGGAEKVGDFWEEVKYFTKEEFRCKCGGKYCNGFPVQPSGKLVRLADGVRSHFGAPATVSSGVRCEIHNANVGGVSGSRHKLGTAMDFCIKGKPAQEVLEYVWKQPQTHYAYAIDSNYVHMDVL